MSAARLEHCDDQKLKRQRGMNSLDHGSETSARNTSELLYYRPTKYDACKRMLHKMTFKNMYDCPSNFPFRRH